MLAMFVCSKCSRRLIQAARRSKTPQWPKATFISLSGDPPTSKPTDRATRSAPPSRSQSRPAETRRGGKAPHSAADTKDNTHEDAFSLPSGLLDQYVPGSGRYSRFRHQQKNAPHTPYAPNPSFPTGINRSRDAPKTLDFLELELPSRGSGTPHQYAQRHLSATAQQQEEGHSAPTGPATTLDEMLDSGSSTAEAWAYFLEHFPSRSCPALVKPSLGDLPKLTRNSVFGKLLQQVLKDNLAQWKRGDGTPTVEQVCAKFDEIGVMLSRFYVDVILRMLLVRVAEVTPTRGPEAEASSEFTSSESDTQLLSSIMPFWKTLFKRHFRAREELVRVPEKYGASPEWPTVPTGAELHSMIGRNVHSISSGLADRVGLYFSTLVPGARHDAAVALTLTLDQLLHRNLTNEDVQPFVVASSYLLFRADLSETISLARAKLSGAGIPEDEIRSILERLTNLPSRGSAYLKLGGNGSTVKRAEDTDNPEGEQAKESSNPLEFYYHHLLVRARETQEYRRVENAWDELQHIYADEGDTKTFQIPVHLYDGLIMTAMALRRPEEAIKFWNAMVENGTNPTVKTWTAMLSGAGQSRNIDAMEEIWQRMIASGIRPDTAAWTARIHSNFSSGRIRQGFSMLNEVAGNWVSCAQRRILAEQKVDKKSRIADFGDFPEAPRPSVALLNAAVTPLAKGNKRTAITNAIKWARMYDIKPDIITFNTLINLALRENNTSEAMQLLQQMDTAEISPDIATFNILIDSALRNTNSSMDPEVQKEAIQRILQLLEVYKLQANTHVMCTLLDRTVKTHGNTIAANVILDYMATKNIKPEAAIFTLIATHYLQQQPPNLGALRELYDYIRSKKYPVDSTFYDRMIQGHAAANDIKSVLFFLGRLQHEQKKPGWRAMTDAVAALERVGERARAMEIVRDIRRGEGIAQHGFNQRDSTHEQSLDIRRKVRWSETEFWDMVQQLRLDPDADYDQQASTAGPEAGVVG